MRAFVPFGRITLVVVALLLAFAFVLVAQSSSITSSSAFRTGTDTLWTTFGGDKSSRRKDISFDLTTPPVAGCEDIVNDLQQQLIQRYSVIFKGIRHANIWGYLETENKGDAAIWAAQQILLSYLGIETMISCRFLEHCDLPKFTAKLEYYRPHSAIIMAGGGNFNDYYWEDQPSRMKMIQAYTNVSIRAFPQSVYMTNEKRIEMTKTAFNKHHDLQLAARDQPSFDWLNETFHESDGITPELIPDIAFMWGNRSEFRTEREKKHDILILARQDMEISDGNSSDIEWGTGTIDVGGKVGSLTYHKVDWRHTKTPGINEPGGPDEERGLNQRAWIKAMDGFELLGSARFVITDRLHGHIMSTVIGVPHVLMDSKLGKNLNFHNTWTRDCECTRITSNMTEALDVARLYFEHNPRD